MSGTLPFNYHLRAHAAFQHFLGTIFWQKGHIT